MQINDINYNSIVAIISITVITRNVTVTMIIRKKNMNVIKIRNGHLIMHVRINIFIT